MRCFFPCLSSNNLLQLLFPLCVPRNHWLQHYSDMQTPHLCHSQTSSVLTWHKAWHPAWLADAGQGSSQVLLFYLLLGSVQHFLPVQTSIFSTPRIHFVAVGYIDFSHDKKRGERRTAMQRGNAKSCIFLNYILPLHSSYWAAKLIFLKSH